MNKVLLQGFVDNEPIIRYFNYNHIRADFVLRTEEHFPAQNELSERHSTLRHNICAWGEVAQIIDLHIREGQQVALEGRLTYDRSTDREGISRCIPIVDCTLIAVVEEAPHSATITPTTSPETTDLDWMSFLPAEDEDPMA